MADSFVTSILDNFEVRDWPINCYTRAYFYFSRQLKGAGFLTTLAANGQQALDCIKALSAEGRLFDVILARETNKHDLISFD